MAIRKLPRNLTAASPSAAVRMQQTSFACSDFAILSESNRTQVCRVRTIEDQIRLLATFKMNSPAESQDKSQQISSEETRKIDKLIVGRIIIPNEKGGS